MFFHFVCYRQMLFALAVVLSNVVGYAQQATHLPRLVNTIDPNINGFYEYLPADYNTSTDKHPLIIFLHGNGERSEVPDPSAINKVLRASLPRFIEDNLFPGSFTVDEKTESFIVLTPQFIEGIDEVGRSSTILPSTIQAFIDYALANYRVNKAKVYLGGMSMGGGAVLDYLGSSVTAAERIAAAAVACPAADLTPEQANIIGQAGVPIVFTQNVGDQIIFKHRTDRNIAMITSAMKPNAPAPVGIYFTVPSAEEANHNAWKRMFEVLTADAPANKNVVNDLGVNIYEWLLHYHSEAVALPATWRHFFARHADDMVHLDWIVTHEHLVASYLVERSINLRDWTVVAEVPVQVSGAREKTYRYTDLKPMAVESYYRVGTRDHDGTITYSHIRKIRPASGITEVAIYPNPFGPKLLVSLPAAFKQQITFVLTNSAGVQVMRKTVTGNSEVSINDHLPAGAYGVRLLDEEGKLLYSKLLMHTK